MSDHKKRVFILEDDPSILETLTWTLKDQNMDVFCASSINEALSLLSNEPKDSPLVCLLDIKIRDQDSFGVLSFIKERSSLNAWGIIMITALQDEKFLETAFKLGADDYVKKPFSSSELVYRIEALFKRLSPGKVLEPSSLIEQLKIDWDGFKITTPSNEYLLNSKEMLTLRVLIENKDKVVAREKILNLISPENLDSNPRSIDNYIVKFRKIFEEGSSLTFRNIRGVGYQLTRK